jgi:hypothetical protein
MGLSTILKVIHRGRKHQYFVNFDYSQSVVEKQGMRVVLTLLVEPVVELVAECIVAEQVELVVEPVVELAVAGM